MREASAIGASVAFRLSKFDDLRATLVDVGEVESVRGYFEAVAHNGGTLAPSLGRILAEEIAMGEKSPLLASYRLSRFLDSNDQSGGDEAIGSNSSGGGSA